MTHPSPSITPSRKHRKLLKTTSGSEEVWSEAIERIFVQGLRDYWASPYANSQGSRGRSRWRNQYLVTFLEKRGIERTKKQVASHIQVLRNMWKGQPEYYLVAGGDDVCEGLGTPVKLEDYDTSNLISMDSDEHDISDNSHLSLSSGSFSPESVASSSLSDSPRTISSLPDTPESSTMPLYSHHAAVKVVHQSPLRQAHLPDLHYPSQDAEVMHLKLQSRSLSSIPKPPDNRITAFSLKAERIMTPFQVNVEALLPSTNPSPVLLHTKLSVPTASNPRCPPDFQGFQASVTVANVWSTLACCSTRVFVGKTCIAEETNPLEVSRIELGRVLASFPESELTKCRWIEPNFQTNIVQDVIIDSIPVFRVVYQLDRSSSCSYPAVELLRYSQIPRARVAVESPVDRPLQTMHSGHPSFYVPSPVDHSPPQHFPYMNASAPSSPLSPVTPPATYGISPIAITSSPPMTY